MSFSLPLKPFFSIQKWGAQKAVQCKNMGQQINAKLSHKNLTYVKCPRLGMKNHFSYSGTFHRKKCLNSTQPHSTMCQRTKKEEMVERFTFAKTLPSQNLSEGDRRQVSKVCPQGKVLEGSWAKFNPNSVFIVLSFQLCTTKHHKGKWSEMMLWLQYSAQLTGDGIVSFFHKSLHSDRRWCSSQSANPRRVTSRGTASLEHEPKQKKRVWQDEAIKASAKPVLSSYSSYTISILEYRQM